jgi:phospholipid/cholesterol/gamma-HCH transport system substrate-binding protein
MLIERSQLVIGLLAVVVIGIGTAFAVFSTGGLLVRGATVTADFSDGAGVGDGDFVVSSGVRVGQVTDVQIIDGNTDEACFAGEGGREIPGGCVRVTMKLDNSGIPDDSIVEVTLQNALGRRQVRIIPGDSGTYFVEGARVGLDQTSTPIDLPELGDRSAELLGGLETERLNALAVSLGDVLEGKEQEVSDLLTALDEVTAVVAARKDELARVLEEASTLVDATADKDQQIVQIIDEFGSTLDLLAQRRTEIARLLEETANATTVSADLVEDRQAQLDSILTELHLDLEIIDDHQVEVADFLAVLGVGFEGYAGIGYHGLQDNPDWGNVFTTQIGPLGYGGLLDCGGVADLLLTTLFGPDPNCEGVVDASQGDVGSVDGSSSLGSIGPTTGSLAATAPDRTRTGYRGLGAWFALGVTP